MEPNTDLTLNTPVTVPREEGLPLFSFIVRREVREHRNTTSTNGRVLVQPGGEWFTFELFFQEEHDIEPRLMGVVSMSGREEAIIYRSSLMGQAEMDFLAAQSDALGAMYRMHKHTKASDLKPNPDWKE